MASSTSSAAMIINDTAKADHLAVSVGETSAPTVTSSAATTDHERQPLLPGSDATAQTKSAMAITTDRRDAKVNGADDGDDGSLPPSLRRARLCRIVGLTSLPAVAAWIALGVMYPDAVNPTKYEVAHSLFDVLLVDAIHLLLMTVVLQCTSPERQKRGLCSYGGCCRRQTAGGTVVAVGVKTPTAVKGGSSTSETPLLNYLFHFTVLFAIGLFSKVWVFAGWKKGGGDQLPMYQAVWSPVAFTISSVTCLLHVALLLGMSRIDFPSTTKLHFASLRKILRPYFIPTGVVNKIIVSVTVIVVLASRFSNIVAPLMMGRAVDRLTADPPEMPYTEVILFGVFSLLPTLFQELQEVLSAWVWRVAFAEVAEHTFRHVHALSLEWHLKKRMGNVVRAMDRGLNAAESLVGWVVLYMGPAFASACATFVLFVVHFDQPTVAAVTAFFLAFYCWLTYVLTMWKRKFNESMNTHDNEMHEKATDALINFETVKYFTNEEYEARNYAKSVRQFQSFSYAATASGAVLNFSQQTAIQLCTVLALLLSANVAMQHRYVTPPKGGTAASSGPGAGTFVSINLYLMQLFEPLSYLGSIYSWIIQAAVNMQNLSQLLAETPDIVDRAGAVPLRVIGEGSHTAAAAGAGAGGGMGVEFRNVTFKYPAQAIGQGLKQVSFNVAPGTTTAIVGHTGSGKTTISRLLFRFYEPQDGEVLVNGQRIQDVTQHSLRSAIGMVPQDTVMFNDSIRHNIGYGMPNATQREIEDVAQQAQILTFIQQLEKGWETVVGERGLKLSGGEKQRVAIARCLLKNPPIVVLDEATSALDNKTEKEVQLALACLRGRTTIIIAHRLTTVQNADQIVVLKGGRVVQRGRHEELLAQEKGEYAEMWFAQRNHEEVVAGADVEGAEGAAAAAPVVASSAAAVAPASPAGSATRPGGASFSGSSKFVHPELEPSDDDDE